MLHKVSTSTLAALAFPALPMAALTLPLVTFLPEHYARTLGVELSVVGLVFMVVRLIDIGIDPLIGALMDRTRSRWGRFKPWLAGGTPVVMAGVSMLFFAQPGVGPVYLLIGLLITYAGYSVIVLAQMALSAGINGDYHGRSRTFAWWQAATTAGTMLVLLLPAMVGGGKGDLFVQAMGWFVVIMTPVSVLVTLCVVRDTSEPQIARRATIIHYLAPFRNAATRRLLLCELLLGLVAGISSAAGIMFVVAVKGLTLQQFGIQIVFIFVIALICAPLWAHVARRIDKHNALALAALCYVAFFILAWFVPPQRLDLLLAISVLAGLSFAGYSPMPRAMLADVGDEQLLETGEDRIGLLYALLTGIYKIGQAVSIGIVFVFLDLIHYDASLNSGNSPEVLMNVSLIYTVLPGVCAIGAATLMIKYPLTAARHAEIRQKLQTKTVATDMPDPVVLKGQAPMTTE